MTLLELYRYADAQRIPVDAFPLGRTEALSLLDGEKSRKAFFVSCCAAYFGDGRYVSSYGICCGSISEKPFIANGFGYDPVFFLDGMGMMISELSDAEKNAISHRGKAMRRLGEKLALIKN